MKHILLLSSSWSRIPSLVDSPRVSLWPLRTVPGWWGGCRPSLSGPATENLFSIIHLAHPKLRISLPGMFWQCGYLLVPSCPWQCCLCWRGTCIWRYISLLFNYWIQLWEWKMWVKRDGFIFFWFIGWYICASFISWGRSCKTLRWSLRLGVVISRLFVELGHKYELLPGRDGAAI